MNKKDVEQVIYSLLAEVVEAMKQHDPEADYLSVSVISEDGNRFVIDFHNRYYAHPEGSDRIIKCRREYEVEG